MENNIKEILKEIKCFLLDLDGTVYLEGQLIGDMKNTLQKIRESGRRIVYLTNNSSRSNIGYVEKLKKIGIFEQGDEVYTSGDSTIAYLNKFHNGQKVYLVGTKELREEFLSKGINLVENGGEIAVLSYDTELDYQKIVGFATHIIKGAKYIATHGDFVCPAKDVYLPDIGSFIAMFEGATGRLPDVNCGKPNKELGDALKEKFALRGEQIMMWGDRLYTDIEFGSVNGIKTALVLSGETTMEDYEKSSTRATIVLDSLNDVVEYL